MTWRTWLVAAATVALLTLVGCQTQKQPTGTTTRLTPTGGNGSTAPSVATAPAAPAPAPAPAPSAPPPEAQAAPRPTATGPNPPPPGGLPAAGDAADAAAAPIVPAPNMPRPRGPADRDRQIASVGAGVAPIPGAEAAPVAAVPPLATTDGWYTVTGRVVFGGDKVPEKKKLIVDKDQEHCLSKGDLFAETWIVHPTNKGVKNCVVFIRPEKGKTLNVHESLKVPSEKQVVLDQPTCYFTPRILVMRADQELLVKNPAPIPHNVVLTSFNNSLNVQLAPGTERTFQVNAEYNAINVTCGAHPWMKASLWVFEHPYFALTDADGMFKIPLVPGGTHNFMIWHEEVGWVLGRLGKDFPIMAKDISGNTDVGTFSVKPE
jgi:hypothetical protein